MTREEAIANLKMISVAFVEPVTKEQGKLIDDTFDMAINALEQEPYEDLDFVQPHKKVSVNLKVCAEEQAEQEPKIGHWEWVQYDGNPEIGNFHCSECRYIPAIFNMSAQKLNYCPKCGAKMQ